MRAQSYFGDHFTSSPAGWLVILKSCFPNHWSFRVPIGTYARTYENTRTIPWFIGVYFAIRKKNPVFFPWNRRRSKIIIKKVWVEKRRLVRAFLTEISRILFYINNSLLKRARRCGFLKDKVRCQLAACSPLGQIKAQERVLKNVPRFTSNSKTRIIVPKCVLTAAYFKPTIMHATLSNLNSVHPIIAVDCTTILSRILAK